MRESLWHPIVPLMVCVMLVSFWGSVLLSPVLALISHILQNLLYFVVNVVSSAFLISQVGRIQTGKKNVIYWALSNSQNITFFFIITQHPGQQNTALDHDFLFVPNSDIPDNLKHSRRFSYPQNFFLEGFYIFL